MYHLTKWEVVLYDTYFVLYVLEICENMYFDAPTQLDSN